MSIARKALMILLPAAVAAMSLGAVPASARVSVFVTTAPPAPRYEPIPPPHFRHPERHAWVPGHWAWSHGQYVWVNGHYGKVPLGLVRWEEGRWERQDRGWVWIDGQWR